MENAKYFMHFCENALRHGRSRSCMALGLSAALLSFASPVSVEAETLVGGGKIF